MSSSNALVSFTFGSTFFGDLFYVGEWQGLDVFLYLCRYPGGLLSFTKKTLRPPPTASQHDTLSHKSGDEKCTGLTSNSLLFSVTAVLGLYGDSFSLSVLQNRLGPSCPVALLLHKP